MGSYANWNNSDIHCRILVLCVFYLILVLCALKPRSSNVSNAKCNRSIWKKMYTSKMHEINECFNHQWLCEIFFLKISWVSPWPREHATISYVWLSGQAWDLVPLCKSLIVKGIEYCIDLGLIVQLTRKYHGTSIHVGYSNKETQACLFPDFRPESVGYRWSAAPK